MDNAEHIAALKITRHWLSSTPKWNFGKFNQDLDQHIYPLLNFRYPLPDDWPFSKKKHITEYVKERKRDLWRKSLTEIINNNDCDSSECKKALRALASSNDVNTDADADAEGYGLYDPPPPRKRKERDEESPPTRKPPPPLGWHTSDDTHSPPLYTSSTRSQEDGRNTSGRPSRNISGSNGGKGVKDGSGIWHGGTGVRHGGKVVKVEREEVEEEEEEEEEQEEEEQEEEEERQGEEARPGVKGSRPRSASNSRASSSPPLPPGFFQEFDDISSECEGCCRHANSIGDDGEPCLDCCSHPPTEVCFSTPSPSSHPPIPSSSQRKTPNLFNDHRIAPSRLASFPPPSNLLRHNETSSSHQALLQRCSLAPQLEQLQSQVASNTKRIASNTKKIASHGKILVHHSKQIKENRQDILNNRGVLATMQRVMFLQHEVDKTMSELKLQYMGDPDDLAGLSSASSTNGNEL